MGEGLFEEFPDLCREADGVLGYSLKDLCLNDSSAQLDNTAFTQPALYAVNALTYFKKIKTSGEPDFLAGHSLGEYDALLAGGAFDFATGLRLVQKRGELMAKQTGGGMAAVIGLDTDKIIQVIQNGGYEIDVANYNSDGQIVVSGRKEHVEKAKADFEAAGARMVVVLKVSGAFHSRLMRDAENEFSSFLNGFSFKPLRIPVISNFTAARYQDSELKNNLTKQISNSVRWIETIQLLMDEPEPQFEEIGPGAVLAGLLKRIKKKALT